MWPLTNVDKINSEKTLRFSESFTSREQMELDENNKLKNTHVTQDTPLGRNVHHSGQALKQMNQRI